MSGDMAHAERVAHHFGELVHGLGVVVWERSPARCQFTFVSRGAEEMFGYPVERWMDRDFWLQLIHPHDRDAVLDVCRAAARDGQKRDYEYRVLSADGRVLWVREILHAVRNPNGEVVQLRGVLANITERKLLYESGQRAREAAEVVAARASSLQAITAALSRALTASEVGEAIVKHGLPGVGAAAAIVARLTDDGTMLELVRAVGLDDDVLKAYQRVPLEASMPMTLAVRSREPVWLNPVGGIDHWYPDYTEHATGLGAGVALPLVVADQAVGVLGLSFAQPRELNVDDREFMLALTAQCAQAMERARLYERERAAHARAEDAARRARFLADAGTALASSLHAEEALQSVARLAVPFLADWCVVDMIDEHGVVRRAAVAHVDPSKEALVWQAQPVDYTSLSSVMRSGRAELVPEFRGDRPAAQDARTAEPIQTLAPRSYIGVPFVARGHILGALLLFTVEAGHRYGPDELAVAQEFAARASQAVDNALLYEQAHIAVRVRDEFLAATSHELRTPLAHIKGFVSTLRQTDVQWDEATQLDFLGEIEREADRLARLIGDLLDISRIESGGLEHAERALVAPRSIVVGGLDRLRGVLRQRAVNVEVSEDLPRVYVDAAQLERVIVNLIDNAVKYAPGETPLRITAVRAERAVELRVEDDGPGIPTEDLERVFDKFVRCAFARSSTPGTGLGLAICRGIVRAHGGRIWAENRAAGGARFIVSLPVDTGHDADARAA